MDQTYIASTTPAYQTNWNAIRPGIVQALKRSDLRVSVLSAVQVADACTNLLVTDPDGVPLAVLKIAPAAFANAVQEELENMNQARIILGSPLNQVILQPLLAGSAEDVSFMLLPFCRQLPQNRIGWWIQRRMLTPAVFGWLLAAVKKTARRALPEEVEQHFLHPMTELTRDPRLSGEIQKHARTAISRIESGKWNPFFVLAHNDLWRGNILRRGRGLFVKPEHLTIIDWRGARLSGHAMYDLVRLADSLRVSNRYFAKQVDAQCRVLQCAADDAMGYLTSALASLRMNLGAFPIDKYLQLVERCCRALKSAVA